MINEELNVNENLIEDKELRNKLVTRIEVLNNVKELLLIPQTDVATVKQIAEYYKVGVEYVQTLYKENKNEFDSDGVTVKSYQYFSNVLRGQLKTAKGKATFIFENGEIFEIPTRGIKAFPKRSILRFGMMLQHSEIAKEIRDQLLNTEEKTSVEIKIQDINEEQKLMMEVGEATYNGDVEALQIANAKMIAFKNRHIKMQEQHIEKLKLDNKALAGQILKWEDRSKINFAVRKLSKMLHKPEGYTWNDLYKELQYKHHINVKLRGERPFIQHIKENEWDKVIQSFSALCESNNISPSDILNDIMTEVEVNA